MNYLLLCLQLDTKEQLRNINLLKVYKYAYDERFANFAGLTDDEKEDTGVLAQELAEVLPDAVKETGDIILPDGEKIENFMVVNKVRSLFIHIQLSPTHHHPNILPILCITQC